MELNYNRVHLCGQAEDVPALSHVNHGCAFYKFTLAVMRLSSFLPLAWFAKTYVNVFRSIPLVMVLLWFYLIVPGFLQNVLGLSPKTDIRLISAMVAFSMFEAAYYLSLIHI